MTTAPIIAADAIAGVVRITGEDAFAYLQSQFSNDLRRPGETSPATYGLWLTRKGRVAADSLVVRLSPEEFLLLSFHTPSEKLSEIVLANVIADDVTAEFPAHATVTVAGNGAADTLVACGLPVPAPGTWASSEGALVVASPRGGESCEVIAVDAASAAFSRILKSVTSDGASRLESLRLERGAARVPEDCGPGDLPQEAGLEAFAVSFNKGCYLGQEVMARLQSQGRPTRALTRLLAAPGVSAASGDKLYRDCEEAGEVRSRASVDAGFAVMAMLKNRVADGAESFALTPGGAPVFTRFPTV